MPQKATGRLARGALLLALGIMIQQLRLLVPLPPVVMTFLIGTLVNTILLAGACYTSRGCCLVMALALPIVAFLQGHLPIPFLVPVIFAGNAMYLLLWHADWSMGRLLFLLPLGKVLVMGAGYMALFYFLKLPVDIVFHAIPFFIVQQWLTGIFGVVIFHRFHEKIM